MANFIYSNIKTKHSQSIDCTLKITKRVLDCSPYTYTVPFIRDGLSHLIKKLSTEVSFKEYMNISTDVNIMDNEFDLEINEIREALRYTKENNPEDHTTREAYER